MGNGQVGILDLDLGEKVNHFGVIFKTRSIKAFPAFLMPLIILGGIYGGIMTPVEAAGIAVIYAIPIAIYVYKGLTWRSFLDTMRNAGGNYHAY